MSKVAATLANAVSGVRLPATRSQAIDLALAGVSFADTVLLFAHGTGGSVATRRLDALGVVLAAAAASPLLAWRRNPLAAFVAAAVPSIVAMLLGYAGGPPIPATVALFLLARSRNELHPWTLRTTGVVVGVFALHMAAFGIGHGTVPGILLLVGALVWAVAWFAGDRTRLRRIEIEELEQRASRAEHERMRERHLAAAEERARIARDLHDSAGHAISVIAVHAGAARLLQARDPARAHAAIDTVERLARQTVAEIDQIVHQLRDRSDAGGVTPSGLAMLDTLVAERVRAGLEVTIDRIGTPHPLTAAVDQAAYRILQEALTNAARHGAGPVQVEVAYATDRLELSVVNAVTREGSGRNGGGHGLAGMSERAALLGGLLEAGRLNGTFRVHAILPYRSH